MAWREILSLFFPLFSTHFFLLWYPTPLAIGCLCLWFISISVWQPVWKLWGAWGNVSWKADWRNVPDLSLCRDGRSGLFFTRVQTGINLHHKLWECSVHPNVTGIETDTVTTTERNCFLALILRSLLQVLTWWFGHRHFVKSSSVQYILLEPSGISYACGAVLQALAYFSEPISIYLAGNEQKNVLWQIGFWHRHSEAPEFQLLEL